MLSHLGFENLLVINTYKILVIMNTVILKPTKNANTPSNKY